MIKKKINIKLFIIFIASLFLVTSCAREKESRVKSVEEIEPKVGFEANMKEIEDIVYNREKEVDWRTVYQAAVALRALKDIRTEEAFLKILERKEHIKLRNDSDLPEVMSPLNMLKAVAMESLRDTGGRKYLEVFNRIYKETDKRILREMAKEHIKTLGGKLPKLEIKK